MKEMLVYFYPQLRQKTKAGDVGLKCVDQILEVNERSFEPINHSRTLEILLESTHFSITVKSNLQVNLCNFQSH